MKKIKFLKKPGYYNGTYPENGIAEVDDNFAAYVCGLGDAEYAKDSDPVTDPIPYIMKPKVTAAEEALMSIADALRRPEPVRNEREAG